MRNEIAYVEIAYVPWRDYVAFALIFLEDVPQRSRSKIIIILELAEYAFNQFPLAIAHH